MLHKVVENNWEHDQWMIIHFLAAVAGPEREAISERSGSGGHKARGKRLGTRPAGRNLRPIPAEHFGTSQAAVRRAKGPYCLGSRF
jgi:DNA invertase Pin-like site-specific DNA recombinase